MKRKIKTMKKLLFILLPLFIISCRGCFADFEQRKAGLQKVCPSCTFVMSEGNYFAVDTTVQPNIIYKVIFKDGGAYYKASDVDHLIRIN